MLSDIAQFEELFHTASGTAFADIIHCGPPRDLTHPQQISRPSSAL
jgi:hypothetical protein